MLIVSLAGISWVFVVAIRGVLCRREKERGRERWEQRISGKVDTISVRMCSIQTSGGACVTEVINAPQVIEKSMLLVLGTRGCSRFFWTKFTISCLISYPYVQTFCSQSSIGPRRSLLHIKRTYEMKKMATTRYLQKRGKVRQSYHNFRNAIVSKKQLPNLVTASYASMQL